MAHTRAQKSRVQSAADHVPGSLRISVDRQEKGPDELSALKSVEQEFGLKAFAIVTLDEVIAYLSSKNYFSDEMLDRISAYRAKYGA